MNDTKSIIVKQQRRKALADALAGLIASLVSLWSFYPIDVAKTNVQANTTESIRSSSSRGLKNNVSYYRGVGLKSLHTASSSFCYFFIYSLISSSWRRGKTSTATASAGKTSSTMLRRLILSAVAAMLNTCLTLPLDVVSARQQTATATDDHNDNRKRTTIDNKATMDQVWNECLDEEDFNEFEDEKKDDSSVLSESIQSPQQQQQQQRALPERREEANCCSETQRSHLASYWKGLYPSLLLCSNPSIHYTVFDSIKSHILKQTKGGEQNSSLSMAQAFVVGLVAKFVATMATYPLIRTKVLLMVTTTSSTSSSSSLSSSSRHVPSSMSMTDCLLEEYARYGLKGWYKGCHLQLFHTLLKSALLMMVRERITDSTHRLLGVVPTTTNDC